MIENSLVTEAKLRRAIMDRLIDASLRESGPGQKANLERWRNLGQPIEKSGASIFAAKAQNRN